MRRWAIRLTDDRLAGVAAEKRWRYRDRLRVGAGYDEHISLPRCSMSSQHWESDSDPNGALLPRAKRHDDKTLVTWSPE